MAGNSSQKSFLKQFLEERWWLLLLCLSLTALGGALTAVLFRSGVHNLEELRLDLMETIPPWIVLPALGIVGGLISGTLVARLAPAAGGSGISHLVGYLHDRPIPMNLKVGIVKLVSGVIAIGSGFPLGAEGPSVQMGGSVAWQIGSWLKAPKSFTKVLVSAGGGAGLAAVFNAPIAGLIFTMEELLHSTKPIILMVIGATVFWADAWGAIFNWMGLNKEHGSFHAVHGFQLSPEHNPIVKFLPIDIIYLIFLGVAVGLIAELYTRYLMKMQGISSNIFGKNVIIKMTICGGIIGLIYAILPDIFHEFTELDNLVIEGEASFYLAAKTFGVMFLTTGLAVASGAPGGLFMPMLTLGAAIGLTISGLAESALGYYPTTLVYAGMGAFVASCSRTPISAVFIVFALTKNALILKTVLVACIFSYLAGRCCNNSSIYERQLTNKLQGELE